MIDNTIRSIETIMGQLKSMDIMRKLMTMILYIAYIIYRIIANNGSLPLNISLGVLTVFYLGFYVCYISMRKDAIKPQTMAKVNRVYRWTKVVFAGIGVGLSVSGFLAVAKDSTSPINLIFAILIPVFFVLQLVCDVLFEYANYCFGMLKESVQKDIENIKTAYEKPIKAVKSIKETAEGFSNFKSGVKNLFKAMFLRKKSPEDVAEVAASDDDASKTEGLEDK